MVPEPEKRENVIQCIFANFAEPHAFTEKELDRCKIDDLFHDARLMGEWKVQWTRSPAMHSIVGMRLSRVPYLADPLRFIEVPSSWWDHFKERWFPAWAKKRWPVARTIYEARAYADPRKLGPYMAPGGLVEWYQKPKELER